jgi:hypothetical protein
MNRPSQFFLTCFLIALSAPLIRCQDYLWPTSASNFVSSSFCEFREGHYHSAIDIKTWLREGFPCYAVDDGYIERIRISAYGYGKVLYLKLKDGNTAVYAHLQKFPESLEKAIRLKQMQNKKYRLDWYPDSIQVKKGDIIAYNGGTGVGPPHLHFEIRNQQDHPLNPLLFYPQHQDNLRPGLKSLICIPISSGATINGSHLPQKFRLIRTASREYTVQQPVRIRGSVGLGIKGFDQAVELGNSFGFYETTVVIDTDTVYQIRYDELSFDESAYIYTEIYYPQWIKSGEVYHKLYRDDYNHLSFFKHPGTTNGIITMETSPVPLSILITDIRSNLSLVKMELLPDTTRNIHSEEPVGEEKSYSANGNPAGKKMNPGADHSFSLNREPELHFSGSDLVFRFQHLRYSGLLRVEPAGFMLPIAGIDAAWSEVLVPAGTITPGKNHFVLDASPQPLWSADLELYPLFPGCAQTIGWFDSALVLTGDPESILDTVWISADTIPPARIKISLPLIAPVYHLRPENFPLFAPFHLQIRTDSLPAWGRWSVYQVESSAKVSYLPSTIDSAHLILSARPSSLGIFIIASDTLAPFVQMDSPQNGQIYSGNPKIRIRLEDLQSGIGEEDNIQLFMDGQFILPEWDPEKNVVVSHLDEPLTPGRHTFTVSVRDRSGNIRRKAINFTVQKTHSTQRK